MGVGELLDRSINLARRHYRELVLVAAWAIVPAYVLAAIFRAILGSGLDSESVQNAVARNDFTTLILYLVLNLGIAVLVAIASAIATAATAVGYSGLIEPGRAPPLIEPGPLYRVAATRLVSLFVVFLLIGLTVGPLFLLIVLSPLGIFLAIRWAAAAVIVMIEGTGPIAALRRSWALTRRSWWHTLGVLVAGGFIFGILSSIAGAVGALVAVLVGLFLGRGVVTDILGDMASAGGAILVTPFSVAYLVLLYYELRARAEGYDLEQRAAQVASLE
jgi:hypothetical protein